jgi:hypothetical protein
MSAPAGAAWAHLRAAAAAFSPPLEVAREQPSRLALTLRDPRSDAEVHLRYRSERGLFVRTYFLAVEADVPGAGPSAPGELVLRRRRLAWRRPRPAGGAPWRDRLAGELSEPLRGLPIERLSLRWRPETSAWRVNLETLAGSVTATFFPPLETPNPLHRAEAAAIRALLDALRRATG